MDFENQLAQNVPQKNYFWHTYMLMSKVKSLFCGKHPQFSFCGHNNVAILATDV